MSEVIGGKYTTQSYVGVPGRIDAHTATDDAGAKVLVMKAPFASQDDADRYAARAQNAAGLAHPDVAKIVDWGSEDGTFYAVQEWVYGKDLRSVVQERGALDAHMVARMGAQAAAALSAAHGRELVHGDLRPEDLVLLEGDDIKLAGLGAPNTADALVLSQDAPPSAAHYMSPEQAQGEAAIAKSDIYSLGAVLYFLATGKVPFDAATGVAVAAMQVENAAEPARRVNPDVPASLENVITKAMEKDPAARYGSAEEMRADLERVAAGGAVAAPVAAPPDEKKKSPWGWIIGILLVVLLAFGAWWFFLRGDIEVPDVSGMTLEQAEAAITGADLALGDIEYSEDYPDGTAEGTVFEQDPEAGSMARSQSLVGVVIAGSELVEIPDVVGMTEAQAVVAIKDAGLDLGDVEQVFDAEVPIGNVVAQSPEAGKEAPMGSLVSLQVSKGEESVVVPQVTGQIQADATQSLETAGFAVKVTQEYSDSVPVGTVIDQSPDAGVKAEPGATVSISVSQGPPPAAKVRVPSLIGLDKASALNEIQAVGLAGRTEYADDPANVDRVVDQLPAANAMVDEGSTVTITVGQ